MHVALPQNINGKHVMRDYMWHDYIPYLQKFGLTPVLVPSAIADPCAYVEQLGVTGLILTGGGDIDPARYGQDPHPATARISPQRDSIEAQLLQHALDCDWPVYGICRGMQFINVFFGGTLVQDIPTLVGDG
ncbi:MAG: hypothetical protein GYB65_00350, partial [Chloroflexi bacterium]|nr:hypothetical protein [Chloroflexota bacterium]